MKASIVDLRYHSKEVLQALDRNEEVTILYRGKEKGTIVPKRSQSTPGSVMKHPFFGSLKVDDEVNAVIDKVRSMRY